MICIHAAEKESINCKLHQIIIILRKCSASVVRAAEATRLYVSPFYNKIKYYKVEIKCSLRT